jgi:hypothetical protein
MACCCSSDWTISTGHCCVQRLLSAVSRQSLRRTRELKGTTLRSAILTVTTMVSALA